MIGFLHPELLLLGIPAAAVWWKTRTRDNVTDGLRFVIALLFLLALSAPYLRTDTQGRDLVVVVDRSRSMPTETGSDPIEIIRLAEEERSEGDRVAVVSFGAAPGIERVPSESSKFSAFEQPLDTDGSDLGAALATALNLIPEGRQGSILLLSDGENNGRDPIAIARRAFGRDVRIDVRAFERPDIADIAVERIDLPGEVAVGEPFQFNVWVRSDRRVESEFRLQRGENVLSSGRRVFEKGLNRVVFRDRLERSGVVEYEVEISNDDDRVPDNNVGLGAVRATGAPTLLVLNDDGAEDTLVRALRNARIPVAVATPEAARLDHVGLSRFRAIVLENVEASRLGPRGLTALRDFVHEQGGGLLVTGGKASFGVGGYFLSELDEILPVSMELRQEHRKLSVAMAIALDRSGSMSVSVTSTMTKMDLANLGTVAAIELLSPMDSISVIAVDSAHHIIVPLTPVQDIGMLTSKVRTIESMGGGIFTHTALTAAVRQLVEAPQHNRHIILFADAADSEEKEGCDELVQRFCDIGGTLSVIALGSDSDSDADFLKRIAKIGKGEAHFTTSPEELPRLFAMDTMTASRSTFIEETTGVTRLPDLFGMGELPVEAFPAVAGYNLTYLRPEAQAGMVTRDSYMAPLFAFMHEGLGRTAAYTGQIGGEFGGQVVAWEGFATFFVTAARWILGNEEPEEFFTSVRREGKDAILSVELDPNAKIPPDTSLLEARLIEPDGTKVGVTLQRTGENLFEARYPLAKGGTTLGKVLLGEDRFVSLPPIVLPYSPEFERSPDPERGTRLLSRIARESGGQVGTAATGLFRGDRKTRLWRVVSRELILAALILLLVEIAGRRLSLWSSLRVPAAVGRSVRRVRTAAAGAVSRMPQRAQPVAKPRGATLHQEPAPLEAQGEEQQPQVAEPEETEETMGSTLARARRAANRKLDR